ncbi:hypothetical protein ACJMK2_035158 [Sinanodonta woodiana]|uniref:Protein kinase domain-containing protein n=1 Tax=Sinanodonta woodiana TaxID=1069815 RepID=A0ABD3WU19_SINWO
MSTARCFFRFSDLLADHGYQIGIEIGQGTFGKVWTVERTLDSETLAVKIFERDKIDKKYRDKHLPREVLIAPCMRHKNIIRTYEVIESNEFILQIMQYAEEGDLLLHIKTVGDIPEEKAKTMFDGLAQGLKYLHDKNIAHRDLKCENILILKGDVLALSDFGFARSFEAGVELLSTTYCGSYAYASPEVLQATPYDAKLNDVWSLGVILYTMVCGRMPFDDRFIKEMVQKQLRKELTFPLRQQNVISDSYMFLVRAMLEPNANQRYTVDQVLSSSWLKEIPPKDQ